MMMMIFLLIIIFEYCVDNWKTPWRMDCAERCRGGLM